MKIKMRSIIKKSLNTQHNFSKHHAQQHASKSGDDNIRREGEENLAVT